MSKFFPAGSVLAAAVPEHELPPFLVNGRGSHTFPCADAKCPSCEQLHTNDSLRALPGGVTDTKATNPKDAIGSTKLPLDLVPDTLPMFAALAFAEGASKYGAYNWRVAGVRTSIYIAACRRHLAKWWNGEECDPATGVPHLANAIACLAIILDAREAEKLNDDRPPTIDMAGTIARHEPIVKALYEKHAHLQPHHHQERDKAQGEAA